MSLDQFVKVYLDYVNNFISVQGFADHYGITKDEALQIIVVGQTIDEFCIDFGHTNR